MDVNEREMLEQLVAEVAILRSAVAVLIPFCLSRDALRAYRNEIPSPVGVPEPRGKALAHFARELDLGESLQRRSPRRS